MAASAGTVTLNLDANSVKLLRELQKAERQTKRSAKEMRDATVRRFKEIGSQSAMLAVAFTTAAAAITRASVNFADAIGKTADKVGVSTAALQELRFAASQAGVAQSALDMGLQRFSRRVGEAVRGQGELRDTLKQYNIELRNTDGTTRSVEAILRDYADAVQGASSKQEQLRLAFKGFDSEGAALVNLLRGGSDAINAYAQEAQNLGIVLEESLIRNAEEVANRMDILNKVLRVKVSAAVLENAEAIGKLVDAMVRLSGVAGRVVSDIGLFFSVITGNLSAKDQLEKIQRDAQKMDVEIHRLQRRRERAIAAGNERVIAHFDKQLEELRSRRNDLAIATKALIISMSPPPDFSAPAPPESPAGRAPLVFPTLPPPAGVDEQKDKFRELRDSIAADMAYVDRVIEDAFQFDDAFERAKVAAENAQETFQEVSVFSEQAARNIQGHFAEFLFDPFENGLKGMLRGFADTLRRMAAEMASAEIFKWLGSSLSGSANPILSALGGFFGGGRASGGPVSPSKGYIVGERGPEWFMPSTAGTIVPNHALGGSVTVNIDARQNDNPGAILSLVPIIQSNIEQSLSLKMRRGYL